MAIANTDTVDSKRKASVRCEGNVDKYFKFFLSIPYTKERYDAHWREAAEIYDERHKFKSVQ